MVDANIQRGKRYVNASDMSIVQVDYMNANYSFSSPKDKHSHTIFSLIPQLVLNQCCAYIFTYQLRSPDKDFRIKYLYNTNKIVIFLCMSQIFILQCMEYSFLIKKIIK